MCLPIFSEPLPSTWKLRMAAQNNGSGHFVGLGWARATPNAEKEATRTDRGHYGGGAYPDLPIGRISTFLDHLSKFLLGYPEELLEYIALPASEFLCCRWRIPHAAASQTWRRPFSTGGGSTT